MSRNKNSTLLLEAMEAVGEVIEAYETRERVSNNTVAFLEGKPLSAGDTIYGDLERMTRSLGSKGIIQHYKKKASVSHDKLESLNEIKASILRLLKTELD
jgi:phage baseplate assembly protein W